MDDYPGKALTPGWIAFNIGNRTVCRNLQLRQRRIPLTQHCGFRTQTSEYPFVDNLHAPVIQCVCDQCIRCPCCRRSILFTGDRSHDECTSFSGFRTMQGNVF